VHQKENNEGDPSKGAVSTKARQGDNLKIEQFKAQLLSMFFLSTPPVKISMKFCALLSAASRPAVATAAINTYGLAVLPSKP